jgi:hypothetical protein
LTYRQTGILVYCGPDRQETINALLLLLSLSATNDFVSRAGWLAVIGAAALFLLGRVMTGPLLARLHGYPSCSHCLPFRLVQKETPSTGWLKHCLHVTASKGKEPVHQESR